MLPVYRRWYEKMYQYNNQKRKFSTLLYEMMETDILVQNKTSDTGVDHTYVTTCIYNINSLEGNWEGNMREHRSPAQYIFKSNFRAD